MRVTTATLVACLMPVLFVLTLPAQAVAQDAQVVVGAAGPRVIYSNFGPGMTFDATQGWTINGFLGEGIGQQAIAQQFRPAVTDNFTSAQVALAGVGSYTIYLQEQGATGLPGAVIEQMTIEGATDGPAVLTSRSSVFPLLRAGMPYWLTVVAGGPGVLGSWNWNSEGDISTENFAGTQDGSISGLWGFNPFPVTRGAFQINGGPIPLTVAIDIKPGSFPNAINPASLGVVPVAILTTSTFDATTTDGTTVRFGPTGTEAAPIRLALEDVDGDGDVDVVLQFRATLFGCADSRASLTGATLGGQPIRGSDSVRIVGCR